MSYERTYDDVTVKFSAPSVSSIDRFLKSSQKGTTKAAQQLCADTVTPESRDAWNAMMLRKPGRAVQVASAMLEDLGYGDDGD